MIDLKPFFYKQLPNGMGILGGYYVRSDVLHGFTDSVYPRAD